MKLLLLSNSTSYGQGYLEHARQVVTTYLEGVEQLVFVPFALADLDGYTAKAAEFFGPLGVEVVGAHRLEACQVAEAPAIFTGGGNTFRLLRALYERDLVSAICEAVVQRGGRYMGASAGTNIAGPTIRTTNDMPIVQPPTFQSLGLLPFQINPHYQDPPSDSTHMGETREQRLNEFLEENDCPVLGIREGTWLHREGDRLELGGAPSGARLFGRDATPSELPAPADVSHLLTSLSRFDTGLAC